MRHYLLKMTEHSPILTYDAVIIGSGLAGLYCALNLPQSMNIAILTKGAVNDCNSELAQGGIAVTLDGMDGRSHIEDTLKAGSFMNDLSAVELLVREGHIHVDKLLEWGVSFDLESDGRYALTKEGGHSIRRVVHSKDTTGSAVMTLLRDRIRTAVNIDVFEQTVAIDVITDPINGNVLGVTSLKDNQTTIWNSEVVVLAAGGLGHLYQHTTNVVTVAGDGIAMAWRAGAALSDMEMVQFHPTAFALMNGDRHFLISEALRGEGAILRNHFGDAIMAGKHPQLDLAPRDIVSKEIFLEMNKHNWSHVFLDATHLDQQYLRQRFPNIYETCLQFGIDISKDMIPICPVEHYSMGGVHTNLEGQTSIPGLYAIGEVAHTGIHGANRLASNSLLEALVFSFRAATHISKLGEYVQMRNIDFFKSIYSDNELDTCIDTVKSHAIRNQARQIVSEHVNIYRNAAHLKSAEEQLSALIQEIEDACISDLEGFSAVNAIQLSLEMVKAALKRPLSIGAHQMEEAQYG